jgi:hypothetical protein
MHFTDGKLVPAQVIEAKALDDQIPSASPTGQVDPLGK